MSLSSKGIYLLIYCYWFSCSLATSLEVLIKFRKIGSSLRNKVRTRKITEVIRSRLLHFKYSAPNGWRIWRWVVWKSCRQIGLARDSTASFRGASVTTVEVYLRVYFTTVCMMYTKCACGGIEYESNHWARNINKGGYMPADYMCCNIVRIWTHD